MYINLNTQYLLKDWYEEKILGNRHTLILNYNNTMHPLLSIIPKEQIDFVFENTMASCEID